MTIKNYTRVPWTEQLFEDLKRHEGLVLKPYRDTVGVWTIGYGHTKNVTKETKPITQREAEDLLLRDIAGAIADVVRIFPTFNQLDYTRKTVLANMAFNLGAVKLAEFKNTLELIRLGRYQEAAIAMLQSRWAKQVKGRATELADRMNTGKIKKEHDASLKSSYTTKKDQKQSHQAEGVVSGPRDNAERDGPHSYGDALREIAVAVSRSIRKYLSAFGGDR